MPFSRSPSLGEIAFMMGCFKDDEDLDMPLPDEDINKRFVFRPPQANHAWRGGLPTDLEIPSPVFGGFFRLERKRASRWVLGSDIHEVDFKVAKTNRYGVSRKCLSIDLVIGAEGSLVLRVTNESENAQLYIQHGKSNTSDTIYLAKGEQDEVHNPVIIHHPKFSFRLWPPDRTDDEMERFIFHTQAMHKLAVEETLEYWPRLDSGLSTVDEASRVSLDGDVYTRIPDLYVSEGSFGKVFMVKRVGKDSVNLCAKELVWLKENRSATIAKIRNEEIEKEFESYSRFSHASYLSLPAFTFGQANECYQQPHLAVAIDIAYMQDGSAPPWLILEHIPFGLADYIDRHPRRNPWPEGPLPPLDSADIICQLFSFAAFLHSQGAVHRDFSPNNVRLYPDKRRWVVKVIDLGLMQTARAIRHVAGTPGFIAPEVLNLQPQDEKVDVFSLGMIAFYLLTGLKPRGLGQAGLSPRLQVRQMRSKVLPELLEVDDEFKPLLGGLLAYEPENRWSAQKVINYFWRLWAGSDSRGAKREASPANSLDNKKRKTREEPSSRATSPTIRGPQAASKCSPSSTSFETAQEQARGSIISVPATPFTVHNNHAPAVESKRRVVESERPIDTEARTTVFCNEPDDKEDWDFTFDMDGWWQAETSDGSISETEDPQLGPSWVTGNEAKTEFLARSRTGCTSDLQGLQLAAQKQCITDGTDGEAETDILPMARHGGGLSTGATPTLSEDRALDGVMSFASANSDELPVPSVNSLSSSCHEDGSWDLKERQNARDIEEENRLLGSFGAGPTLARKDALS